MKTRPLLLGSRSFSFSARRVFGHWYLLPGLSLDSQLPLGGAVTAARLVFSFLLWRLALDVISAPPAPRSSLSEFDFQEFVRWLAVIHSPYVANRDQLLTLLGTNPALERLVLVRGLRPYYVKVLLLKTLLESH